MGKNIIFLGPPGAGKGTHAQILSQKKALPHISTGDILRARIKDGSPLGQKAKSFVESGKLVPDALVIEMVEDRLNQADVKDGYILDGFPRTVEQAEALERFQQGKPNKVNLVINFDTPEEVVVERISGRRVAPKSGRVYHIKNRPPKKEGFCDESGEPLIQRKDDNEDTVRERLKVYHEQTAPLIKFYQGRGLLKTVQGGLDIDSLQGELARMI